MHAHTRRMNFYMQKLWTENNNNKTVEIGLNIGYCVRKHEKYTVDRGTYFNIS